MKSKNNIDFGFLTSPPMVTQMRRANYKEISISSSPHSNSNGKKHFKSKEKDDNYSFGKSSLDGVNEENNE